MNPSKTAPGPLTLDITAMLERVGGDRELLQSLAEMFPEESTRLLGALENARLSGEPLEVQRHAHTLKGICRVFNAEQAAEAAFAIELEGKEQRMGTEEQMHALRMELERAVEAISHLTLQA